MKLFRGGWGLEGKTSAQIEENPIINEESKKKQFQPAGGCEDSLFGEQMWSLFCGERRCGAGRVNTEVSCSDNSDSSKDDLNILHLSQNVHSQQHTSSSTRQSWTSGVGVPFIAPPFPTHPFKGGSCACASSSSATATSYTPSTPGNPISHFFWFQFHIIFEEAPLPHPDPWLFNANHCGPPSESFSSPSLAANWNVSPLRTSDGRVTCHRGCFNVVLCCACVYAWIVWRNTCE